MGQPPALWHAGRPASPVAHWRPAAGNSHPGVAGGAGLPGGVADGVDSAGRPRANFSLGPTAQQTGVCLPTWSGQLSWSSSALDTAFPPVIVVDIQAKKHRPRVTSGGQKTGCANRNFSVYGALSGVRVMPRTTGLQGFAQAATNIVVDAAHPARMPGTPPWSVVVILRRCPEKSRSNALSSAATAGSR